MRITKNQVDSLLRTQRFTFAKTMASIPHEWSEVKEWSNREVFEEVVQFMRENSLREVFFKKEFLYYYANGYKYWTMGAPLHITRIINRVKY